jgi:hypothetical protein
MSTDRDFDRLARAWLDLLPSEAPDRAVDAVLQAIETTPQVRQPWRWLNWRFPAMNRAPVLIGAAAVIAVAGLGALFGSRSGPPVAATPIPSPSTAASASATAVGSPLPAELQGRWMGDHSDLAGVVPDAGTTILFTETGIALSEASSGPRVVLRAAASAAGPGRLRLTDIGSTGVCASGNTGLYAWVRSSDGRTLTITAEGDDCASRADAVAGTWWLMGCKDPDNYCLGQLSAGQYASQFIAPRLDRGATWSGNFGAVRYAVPDGWANSSDLPESFELMPTNVFATAAAGEADRSIGIATQPAPLAKDATCQSLAPAGRGSTMAELVTWIGDVPGLIATDPRPITIGGMPGRWFDLRADPAFTTGCHENRTTIVEYQTAMYSGLLGSERQRLIYLDLGDGDVLSITIRTANPADFDAFVAEALPIVESLTFE